MEYNDKQIGRNIKAIRNANKKSYLDFADAIGISDSLLEKIENGTRHATDEIIQLISKSTGFSFNEIKYKDLSYLEKGELYFDEECSILYIFESVKHFQALCNFDIIHFMLSLSFSCNKQHYLYYPIMTAEYLLRYLLIIL